MSQRKLAAALSMPESVISRGLRHYRGFDPHWPAIARAIGVSLDWLMFGDAPPGRVAEAPTTYDAAPALAPQPPPDLARWCRIFSAITTPSRQAASPCETISR